MGTHLTDTEVRNAKLPDGKDELTLTDLPGLYLRLRRGVGAVVSKSWLYRYTFAGAKKKITLGSYPQMGLAEARLALAEQQRLTATGHDPVATKLALEYKRHADVLIAKLGRKPETLEDLFEQFLDKYAKATYKDGGAASAASFNRHVRPYLGSVKLEHITTVALANMLHKARKKGEEAVYSKGHARTLGVVLNLLKTVYGWGYDSGHIENNPAAGLKAKSLGASKGEMGERFLTEVEIQELYYKLEFSTMAPRWKHMAWLMLACLTRVEETSKSRVEHVDLKAQTWLIPKENQKSTRKAKAANHVIHLSEFAVAHMRALLEDAARRKKTAAKAGKDPEQYGTYLFPARLVAAGETHCNEKTATHQFTDRQKDPNAPPRPAAQRRTQDSSELLLPGGHWSSHDLRRTGATRMRRLGVSSDAVERCLNHQVGSELTRTYQKHEYAPVMQQGFDTLGAHLAALVEQAKADKAQLNAHKLQAHARKEAKNKAQARKMKITKEKNKLIYGGLSLAPATD